MMTPRSRKFLLPWLPVLAALLVNACSDGSDSGFSFEPTLKGCADTGTCVSNPPLQIGDERPAQVFIPADYTPSTRYPLIISLYGFGASGVTQAYYMGMVDRVDRMQLSTG